MDKKFIEHKLIEAGVKNLKEFGYEYVDSNNILTDEVYQKFFESMLKENKGLGFDVEIDELLLEINNNKNDNQPNL